MPSPSRDDPGYNDWLYENTVRIYDITRRQLRTLPPELLVEIEQLMDKLDSLETAHEREQMIRTITGHIFPDYRERQAERERHRIETRRAEGRCVVCNEPGFPYCPVHDAP